MPTNEELEGQLKIQQDINKVLAKRAKMFEAQTGYLDGQARIAKELCKALECEGLEDMEERLDNIQKGLKKAGDQADTLAKNTSEAAKQAQKASDNFDKMAAVAAAGAAGAINGFKGAISTITSVGSAITRVVGGIFNIGKAIVSIPFKMLNGLVGMASKGGGGADPLKEAWEEVRKTFGSLSEGMGGALKQGFKELKKQSHDLAGTGKSLRKLYGPGRAGLAAAVKELSGRFAELGASASRYADEVKGKNLPIMAAWSKGLYNSAEDMKALDHISRTTGKSMTEAMGEFGNQTIQMASKFGLDRKQFSADMMAMAGDAEYFGGVASTELAAMTVYIQKLGMEAKSLKSLIDKWDNFESAAEGASKLAQSFGMNVDAMAMMNEQNPAKRMDMLRDSFFESGKAVEDLTRAEKKLLAEQMGLADVADLEKALADPSMSYDDIQAEAEANAEGALTQEQAMSKLADSLDRVFGSGGGKQFASFGDALLQGFMKGMSKNKEFQEMLKAVRCALYQIYLLGVDLGEAFAKMDSVNGVFSSIANLFNSFDWKGFREGVLGAFTSLWEGLESPDGDPVELVGKFIDDLVAAFTGAADESALGGVTEAFSKLGLVIGRLALGMVPHIMEGIAVVVEKITTGLTYLLGGTVKDDAGNAIEGAMDGMDPAMKKAMGKIQKKFEDRLLPALRDLWAVLEKPLGDLGGILMSYIFAKTIISAAISAGMSAMTMIAFPLIKDAIAKRIWPEAAKQSAKAAPKAASKMVDNRFVKAAGKAFKSVGTKVGNAAKFAFSPSMKVLDLGAKGLEKMGSKKLLDATKRMGGDAAKGFKAGFKHLDNVSTKQIMKSSGSIAKKAGKMGGKLAKLGVKAVPIAGWAIAIADGALGMSKQMDIAEKKLQKKFGDMAGTAGAGAQGVVEFLTLGLLPQPMLDAVGNFTAMAVEAMGGLFDMLGLKGVYDMLVQNFNMITKVFAGIGDVLVGLFTGDSDKVVKGFEQMFEGVWNFVKSIPGAFVSLLVELPWTIIKFLTQTIKTVFITLPLTLIGAIRKMFVNAWDAITGIFDDWGKESEESGESFMTMLPKKAWKWISDGFTKAFSAVGEFFTQIWNDIVTSFKDALGISSPSTVAIGWGQAILDGIWSIISFLPRKFFEAATWAWEKLTGVFAGVGTWAAGLLTKIWDGIKALPGKISELATKAWNFISDILGFKKLLSLGKGMVDGVLKGLANIGGKIKEKFKNAWKGVKSFFGFASPAKEAANLGGGLTDGMMNGLSDMAGKVKQPFIDAWNFVKSLISPAAVLEHFTQILNVISGLATAIWNVIKWPYETAWNWIAGIFGMPTFNEIFGGILSAIQSFTTTIWEAIKAPFQLGIDFITGKLSFEEFSKIGGAMLDGIMDALWSLPGKIKDIIKDAVGGVGRFLGIASPSKLMASMGGFMSDGMMGGFSGMKDKMVAMFDGVMSTIKSMFDNVLETFGINTAVDRIINAFIEPREIIDALTSEYDFLAWGLEDLTYQVDKIANMITGSMVDRVIQSVDMISEIVENYNEINDLLAEIDPINLDARIDRLGQNMSLSRETITIRNKPINISVNLHATIDGKRLATSLSSKNNGVQLAVAGRNGTVVANNVG